MRTINQLLPLLLLVILLSSCTVAKIGKFNSVKIKNVPIKDFQKPNNKKVGKSCTTQVFAFPVAAHDIEGALLNLCPQGGPIENVVIHEEFWTTFVVGQTCTVATGQCARGRKK